jgi:hypothetical protein
MKKSDIVAFALLSATLPNMVGHLSLNEHLNGSCERGVPIKRRQYYVRGLAKIKPRFNSGCGRLLCRGTKIQSGAGYGKIRVG